MRPSDFARRYARIQNDHHRSGRWHRAARRALVKRSGAATIILRGRVVGYRLPDGGVACVKHRYTCEASAAAELERIARDSVRSYIPVRAYRCEFCDGWHLTSSH